MAMASNTCRAVSVAFVIIVVLSVAVRGAPTKLQAYNVALTNTSVSGLSSGGFFAVQLHVAFSSFIRGAGVFAGGPYHCAEGDIDIAKSQCMNAFKQPPVADFIQITDSRASKGQLDATSNMANSRVYLFSGTADTVVRQPVMDGLYTYYKNYVTGPAGSIVYVDTLNAAHTQPTDDPINKNPCNWGIPPYVSDCDYDGAGLALNQIYGNLTARNNGRLSGSLVQFDQTEFISTGFGMASAGWLYVPASCAAGAACTLHVALHGCSQNYETVGNAFINNTGYNKWADTNDMIILYPQTTATWVTPPNPNGCWDWWGYNNDPSTYDLPVGYQMAAIKKMIDRITSGGVGPVDSPTGLTVTGSTTSSISLKWLASTSSGVTGYNVYRDQTLATTSPVTGTTYTDSGLLSGTNYTYFVRALAGTVESAPSNSVQASTLGSPPPLTAPQNLQVKAATANSVTLTWSVVGGASSYNVYRNSTLAGSSAGTTFVDHGLAANSTYQYTVRAVNALGEGPASTAVTATTSSSFVCTSTTSSNFDHVQEDRAYSKLGYAYAVGSNDNMGLNNIFVYTTLAEIEPDFYIVGDCPSQ